MPSDNISPAKKWPASQVEMRPVDSLTPYARNARTHSDQQIDQIAASMKEWGWTNPVLADEDGTIIAGHGRVLAAQKLGYTECPVMVAEGWTDAQKRAYVIADNKLALNAGWDTETLSLEFKELEGLRFELGLTGFSDNEIDEIRFDGNFEPGSEEEQGKLDEKSPKPVTCPHCGEDFDASSQI